MSNRNRELRRRWGSKSGRVQVDLRLEETEKKLIYALAIAQFPAGRFGKPAVAKAVAHLLRLAFYCLREHVQPADASEAAATALEGITSAQIREEGLTQLSKRSERRPRIRTLPRKGAPGEPYWDPPCD